MTIRMTEAQARRLWLTEKPAKRKRKAALVKSLPISEAAFLAQILKLARLHGWLRAHFRPGRTKTGWRTAVSADGVGFVDLVLVKDRVIWAETKTDNGKLRPEQETWIAQLRAAGAEVYVWRPSDFEQIQRVLAGETS